MGWLIWAGILPLCLFIAVFILHRPLRLFLEELHVDQARESFHLQREWLEVRFITAVQQADAEEALRWEEAQWHDEIIWARDRQTRRFLALVGVTLESQPLEPPRLATAVFEYSRGRWYAQGKRLYEIRPDEAVGRNRRFEPVVIVHPNIRRIH